MWRVEVVGGGSGDIGVGDGGAVEQHSADLWHTGDELTVGGFGSVGGGEAVAGKGKHLYINNNP